MEVLGGKSAQRNIVAWGHIEGENAVFAAVGRNTGYFPVYYKNNETIAAGNPFLLDSLGNVLPVVDGLFNGPHILSFRKPCIIQMRDFDIGGEGVAFHDDTYGNTNGNNRMYRILGGDPFSFSVGVEDVIGNVGFIADGL